MGRRVQRHLGNPLLLDFGPVLTPKEGLLLLSLTKLTSERSKEACFLASLVVAKALIEGRPGLKLLNHYPKKTGPVQTTLFLAFIDRIDTENK